MNKKPYWMCLLEWEKANDPNWELVHNGQMNPGQFEFPPEDVRYFTRKYRNKIKMGFMGLVSSITFKYDRRSGFGDIVKIELESEDGKHRKAKEMFEMSDRRGRV